MTADAELPQDLLAIAEEFDFAAAPYDLHRSDGVLGHELAASFELAGFMVGIVSLLISLIGVYDKGDQVRRDKVPDFEKLLSGLLEGSLSPADVITRLARWKPELSPIEVAELWRSGDVDRYRRVLAELGYPPAIVADILAASFGAISAIEPL